MSDNPFQPLMESVRSQTKAVESYVGRIDERMSKAEGEFDNYIANARQENSNIRISRNQALFTLKDDNSAIDDANIIIGRPPLFYSIYFSSPDDGTVTHELIRVRSGSVNPESSIPADFKRQVLGVSSDAYLDTDFYIWHITWAGRTPYYGFQFSYTAGWARQPGFLLNSSAYVKVASGSVSQGMCHGAVSDNQWHLCGTYKVDKTAAMAGKEISSCRFDSREGEIFIALPALVMGGVPDKSWDYFPYVNTLSRNDSMSNLPAAAENIL